MGDAVRRIVSQKKKRFEKDGLDLDLTYITEKIIAMGFPSESLEGMYRNKLSDVQRFFSRYHPEHFRIYNLCSERQYDPALFDNRVVRFPFDDHNPCPFEMIPKLCEDANEFLNKDAKNVVAVHCKAGKGRTGMMISCLLLYLGKCKTAAEALDFFGTERTSNKKGVTIPSQMRYVHYFEQWLNVYFNSRPFPFSGSPVRLTKIILSSAPNFDTGGGCDPYFIISNMSGNKLYNSKKHSKLTHWNSDDPPREFECNVPVDGDIHFCFYDSDATSQDDKMFSLWIHSGFLQSGKPLRLTKTELDKAAKDKSCQNFDSKFTCEIHATSMSSDEFKSLSVVEKQADWKKSGQGITNKVRGLVSQKKLRYQEDGFDLDLSYITERVIAMGFPSAKVEGLYRNHMKDVQRFFQKYHEHHFKVYNLCSERMYDAKSFEKVGGQCGYFPFNDHNPSPFDLIPRFIQDCLQFLARDERNTVAIHCKAGKGRTGMMVSCLLLALELAATAEEAIDMFATLRTANKKGITIPSQKRYVRYFEQWLQESEGAPGPDGLPIPAPQPPFIISKIVLKGAPNMDAGGGCDPYFIVYRVRDNAELWNSKKVDKRIVHWGAEDPPREFTCQIPVMGDIRLVFFDQDSMNADDKFSSWFHTGFIKSKQMVLGKNELDGPVKDKHHKKYPASFSCTIYFEKINEADYKRTAKPMLARGSISRVVKRQKGHKGANKLRALVSKKKLRFQQDGFDLDLSYVTDRIIAMGFPSMGAEGVIRNPMKQVKRFFQKFHDKKFKVYNLCSERKYDNSKFTKIGGQVAHWPFDDHNPCALSQILPFCEDVKEFMDADPKNIVAIHCKAGKGRTGLLISCLLMYFGEAPDSIAALEYYGNARTANKKGVTIPSQRRYVQYFEYFLKNYRSKGKSFPFEGIPITLTGFGMNIPANFDVGGGCDPYFKLHNLKGECLYNMRKDKSNAVPSWRSGPIKIPCKVPVKGDVKITFYDKDKVGKDDKMFSFWIHTSCIESNQVAFIKSDLDKAVKDKRCERLCDVYSYYLLGWCTRKKC